VRAGIDAVQGAGASRSIPPRRTWSWSHLGQEKGSGRSVLSGGRDAI